MGTLPFSWSPLPGTRRDGRGPLTVTSPTRSLHEPPSEDRPGPAPPGETGAWDNARVKMTPMLRQYLDLKQEAGDALLLYRMGDFYELFFEDAEKAAPVLGIVLTRRRHNDEVEAPMCGIPHHAFDAYIGKLLGAGFRVAVAEQVEDPAKAKGLVRREIVRIHTPGTVADADLLEGSEHCFLAAVGGDPAAPSVAWFEVSTGTFEGMDCPDRETASERLALVTPRELLVAEGWDGWRELWPRERPLPTVTPLPAEDFSPAEGERRLLRALSAGSLRGFGLAPGETLVGLAGVLVGYVDRTQRGGLGHVRGFRRRHPADGLVLDRATVRNLEIIESSDGSRRSALATVLDHTLTRMGARLLRDWLLHPSAELEIITGRHLAVEDLVGRPDLLAAIRETLRSLPDLERITARVALGQATPRELVALRQGLGRLPELLERLEPFGDPMLSALARRVDPVEEARTALEERLADDPPAIVGVGVIREGWDAELDEARRLSRGGREALAGIELRERERTGIGSLKVRYNKVFGYYIEVPKTHSSRVPEDYERRQTLTSAERYVTPELKELESRILSAEEVALSRERELYAALVTDLGLLAGRLSSTASSVAELDVLAAFADRARSRGYVRPEMDTGGVLRIREGRHPVLEEIQKEPPFVPNDCDLDGESTQIVLLTGPNMGGKSTYLRQVALITLMAHAGSWVPAAEAVIGLTDRIFTRVGAADMLARGESTFMVEMTETANILRHATPRSLVILDEVGRGTATFDGLSLAWAIVEHLHDHPEHAAKVLFATHYHELTELASLLPRLRNRSMAVKEWRGRILFLHRVVDGPADRSYGIHVARLAGVPEAVCRRSEEILANLERHELSVTGDPAARRSPVPGADRIEQLPLFRPPHEEIIEALREAPIDRLTPLDALNLLARLKEKLDREP